MTDISQLDRYVTSQGRVAKNTIRIYDMTRSQYEPVENYNCISSDALSSWTNDCLGIFPVIVTPTNAMFF